MFHQYSGLVIYCECSDRTVVCYTNPMVGTKTYNLKIHCRVETRHLHRLRYSEFQSSIRIYTWRTFAHTPSTTMTLLPDPTLSTPLPLDPGAVNIPPDQHPEHHSSTFAPEPSTTSWLDCPLKGVCLNDPCNAQKTCYKGLTCEQGVCVLLDGTQPCTTIPGTSNGITSPSVSSLTITTLIIPPTSTISIPTSTPLLSSSLATLTPQASTTAPSPSPPAQSTHNHAIVYISIPFTLITLLILGIVIYKRWRRLHASPSIVDATSAAQIQSGAMIAGLATNNGAWTGKGYREYRSSAATVDSLRVSVKNARGREGEWRGSASKWLDE